MSWTVSVVPMSAPRMTPSVWRKVMRPADTKPISMIVAAVGDDEHVIAVRMGGADPVDGLEHPPAHVGQRLGSGRRAVERRSDPRPVRITDLGADLVDRAALPRAERELTELLDVDERHAGAGQRDLGGLPRPRQWAHVRRDRPIPAQGLAEGAGLSAAGVGERDVGAALEASHLVPQRLAVTREQQPHVDGPMAWRAAVRRASVSSRPSSARTSNRGGDAALPVTARRVSWARSTSLRPRAAVCSR